MTLYILEYNNYYNRLVKQEESLEAYMLFVNYELFNTNFNPNDSINTQHVIGNGEYDGKGDYLLAVSEDNEIVSRWFIINSERTRAGQWQLTLHRDLVVDYYNIIVDSPMYIEKATLIDSDVAIYNSEGVSVNQIKTKEYLLKDDSKCSWLVGYIARDQAELEVEITYSNPEVDITLPEGETISQYVASLIAYTPGLSTLQFYLCLRRSLSVTSHYYRVCSATLDTYHEKWILSEIGQNSTPYGILVGDPQVVIDKLNNDPNINIILSQLSMYSTSGVSYNDVLYKQIDKLDGKIVTSSTDDKYYQLQSEKTSSSKIITVSLDKSVINGVPSIHTYLCNIIGGETDFTLLWSENKIQLTYKPISFETFNITFPGESGRVHLNDAPYDMFCVPYKVGGLDIEIIDKSGKYGGTFVSMDDISALTAVQSLVKELGKDNIYDVQLLPYCPLQGWTIDPIDGRFIKYVDKVSETGSPQGLVSNEVIYVEQSHFVIFFSTSSQGSFNSEQLHLVDSQSGEEVTLPLPMDNVKISNECDRYRLVSPNYNGQFEFTASKMGGITGFNVDYTYLPYSPYIHVNPNFNNLYGQDFDDARGLICQGDFSISYLSDAWENYQVLNKNYANIFARGTENLELTQGIQRKQQVFNAVTGTVMGISAGALTGSKGGGAGAIAGGIIGGVSSAIGGALDVHYGDILRNEALDYRQDLFNYQLDNIQALPDSIAKVTAYTKNNKIFPILEYYTCTDTEKKAIANKVAYNGMTVMRIGTINEFVDNTWSYEDIESKNYIKGQLIRLEGINEDYRIVNAISGELVKGVYFK